MSKRVYIEQRERPAELNIALGVLVCCVVLWIVLPMWTVALINFVASSIILYCYWRMFLKCFPASSKEISDYEDKGIDIPQERAPEMRKLKPFLWWGFVDQFPGYNVSGIIILLIGSGIIFLKDI